MTKEGVQIRFTGREANNVFSRVLLPAFGELNRRFVVVELHIDYRVKCFINSSWKGLL